MLGGVFLPESRRTPCSWVSRTWGIYGQRGVQDLGYEDVGTDQSRPRRWVSCPEGTTRR